MKISVKVKLGSTNLGSTPIAIWQHTEAERITNAITAMNPEMIWQSGKETKDGFTREFSDMPRCDHDGCSCQQLYNPTEIQCKICPTEKESGPDVE